MSKVMVIALDSLEATLLRRLVAEKRLPNLAQFAAEAQSLDVTSKANYLPGAIWPTFATGLPAGHHGVYFWMQWLAEDMRHYRNAKIGAGMDVFWKALGPAGKRAVVVDMPYVPLVKQPGFRGVVGWGLHDELVPDTYPDGFAGWLKRRYGRHPLQYDTVEPHSPEEKLQLTKAMSRGLALRGKLIEDLAGESDWDLLMVMAGELHMCSHYLTGAQQLGPGTTNVDAMTEVLLSLDEAWPRILKAAGDCHVMLMSIQGMSEQREYEPLGAQVLALMNGRPPWDWHAKPDLLRRVRELLPDRVHRTIWQALPSSFRAARQGAMTSATYDFAHDKLFSVVYEIHSAVRVNQQGREQPGVVAPEDAPALLDSLEAFIREFRTQDGLPAYTGLWRMAEEEPGPMSYRLPDALMLTNPEVLRVTELRGPDGIVLKSARREARNGAHNAHGFCYLRPAKGEAANRNSVDNLDFAPTILDLLDVPHERSFMGSSFVA